MFGVKMNSCEIQFVHLMIFPNICNPNTFGSFSIGVLAVGSGAIGAVRGVGGAGGVSAARGVEGSSGL